MTTRTAFITGITGQDGALLAELLLQNDYIVHGLVRRSSSPNTQRIDHLLDPAAGFAGRLHLHHGDLTDGDSLQRALANSRADEVYNLGAQSHVHVSFSTAVSTAEVNALGPVRVLEAIRALGRESDVRFYQASTSEMFGDSPPPQNETTPFAPRSPYAIAKLYAYWMTVNYRTAYGMHASNGILFNHEGPTRGESFVTRKITRAVAAIEAGKQERIALGNLNARRDWGHARDFVEGIWKIVQHDDPLDFVLATGETHSVREFVVLAFQEIGVELQWEGEGIDERGLDKTSGVERVVVDPEFFRPTDVNHLIGDASKSRDILGWEPRIRFEELVREMVAADRLARELKNG